MTSFSHLPQKQSQQFLHGFDTLSRKGGGMP